MTTASPALGLRELWRPEMKLEASGKESALEASVFRKPCAIYWVGAHDHL